jgi:hypothetical protein
VEVGEIVHVGESLEEFFNNLMTAEATK